MSRIEAVVSDFGGVLTSPLIDSFLAFQEASGVPLDAMGKAIAALASEHGRNPLFELETGRLSEARFLEQLSDQLTSDLGRRVELHGFAERYLEQLHPNPRMIEYMRELRGRGYRMAICTNNIREWERLWRAKLPVDEITLERLGTQPQATLFVDDVEVNCAAARELGMRAVWFHDAEQTIEEMEAALGAPE